MIYNFVKGAPHTRRGAFFYQMPRIVEEGCRPPQQNQRKSCTPCQKTEVSF